MPILLDKVVITGTVNGSSVTHTQQLVDVDSFSVQLDYTGAGSGSAKLQASNDNATFIDVPDSTRTIAGGEADTIIWEVSEANYQYLKIVATSASGDKTFTGRLTLKRRSQIA